MDRKWFTDIDEDSVSEYRWAPFIQVTGGVHQLDGIWFKSEEDCERFIVEEIL